MSSYFTYLTSELRAFSRLKIGLDYFYLPLASLGKFGFREIFERRGVGDWGLLTSDLGVKHSHWILPLASWFAFDYRERAAAVVLIGEHGYRYSNLVGVKLILKAFF